MVVISAFYFYNLSDIYRITRKNYYIKHESV